MMDEKIDGKKVVRESALRVDDSDVKSVLGKSEKILELLGRIPALDGFIEDVRTALSMIRDYVTGEYREVPWSSIAAIVGALIYLLNPMDLVPDMIPFVGFLDDAAVLKVAFDLIRQDLEKYRRFKNSQS